MVGTLLILIQDATDEYGPIHPAGTIEKNLPPGKLFTVPLSW